MAQPRVFASVIATSTAGVLPVFLLGGMAVQVRADLSFPESSQGWVVFGYFGVSALGSAAFGRLVERIGPVLAMRVSSVLSASALAGAATAPSLRWLLVWLAFGGFGNSLAQPGSNALIVAGVPARRNGLAFGVKQSAIPAATLLAGLAVPSVALTVGWRWAFAGAAAAALGAALLVPAAVSTAMSAPVAATPAAATPVAATSAAATAATDVAPSGSGSRSGSRSAGAAGDGRPPRRSGRPEAALSSLVVLGIGAGLGSATANCLGAFLTSTAVHSGVGRGAAGALLSLGSVIGLSSRLFAGWRADTMMGSYFRVVIAMQLVGAIGIVLLAAGRVTPLLVGTVVGFGAGWAWPGLFNLAVVAHNRSAPAAATGITQTGTYAGSAIGPVVFGYLVTHGSYRVAWLTFAAVTVSSAAVIEAGRRRIEARPTPIAATLADPA